MITAAASAGKRRKIAPRSIAGLDLCTKLCRRRRLPQGNQKNQRLSCIYLILLVFMLATFCGNGLQILEAGWFEPFRHERSTDLSTENVHKGK
jgi:hypothetical protein